MLKVVNGRPHEKGDLINQYLRLQCTCYVARFMLFTFVDTWPYRKTRFRVRGAIPRNLLWE